MSVSNTIPFKICIVSDQLAIGGAERCSAILSVFFEKNNCEIYHVIVVDKIEYEFSGKLLNLGKLKSSSNSIFNKAKRLFVLKDFFKNNEFNFIIDTRVKRFQWQEFWIANFVFNAPLLVVVHSFMTEMYFPKSHFLAKKIYKNAFKIISVSKAIENKVVEKYNYQNCTTIHNPIDFEYISEKVKQPITENFKFILAVGNMNSDVKQFDKLIKCYAKSNLPNQKIKLVILGDGLLKQSYIEFSKALKVYDYIVFKGTIENPFPYYKNALFTVLSSKNEGFPNVILESLACETPVVAFDCESGPNEIISNKQNGVLVENQNENSLINAMNEMFFDEKLYYHCKANAKQSVEKFSIDTIGKQWLDLMKMKTV